MVNEYKPLMNLRGMDDDAIIIHVDEIKKIQELNLNGRLMYQVSMKDGTFAHVQPSEYSKFLEFCRTA